MPAPRQQPAPEPIPTTIGPWTRGMVNTVSDHAVPLDALVDARDLDIDRDGFTESRPTYALLSDASPYTALYEHARGHFAVAHGEVGILGSAAFEALRPVVGAVGWTDLNGLPVYCDSEGVYQIEGLTVTQLAVRPTLEEEERYGLVDMPGGKAVGYWQGRIIVLRGKSLLWSEPLDYGCHSPARNFVRLPTTPTWMAPLPSGIFIGLKDSVIFLAGTDPAEFKLRTVSGPSCPSASLVIDSRHFSSDLGGSGPVALWFSDVGFVVGREGGGVVYPQAGNLRGLPIVPRTLAFINDRVYAFATEE